MATASGSDSTSTSGTFAAPDRPAELRGERGGGREQGLKGSLDTEVPVEGPEMAQAPLSAESAETKGAGPPEMEGEAEHAWPEMSTTRQVLLVLTMTMCMMLNVRPFRLTLGREEPAHLSSLARRSCKSSPSSSPFRLSART